VIDKRMVDARSTAQQRAPDALRPERIGERLRALRLANGLKQSEMANLLGIDPPHWSRWERGHRPIPTDMAWQLTQLFEVDLDYIFAGETRSVPVEMQRALIAASRS
jgi:transcriptional regulator with XRE-family HTH domain